MKRLKLSVLAYTVLVGILCAICRAWLFSELDIRGLYDVQSPLNALLVGCLVLSLPLLWLCCAHIGEQDYRFFSRAPIDAIGCLCGCFAHIFLLFQPFDSSLFIRVAYLLIAVCFLLLSVFRFQAKKPPLMLPALLCAGLLLTCFSQYQLWRHTTQLQQYLFPACNALFLALYAYQMTELESPGRKRRFALFCNLAAVLCAIACLGTQWGVYYALLSLWLLSGLFTRPYAMTLPEPVQMCIQKLEVAGFQVYAVGGCVRDSMLGLSPHDYDLCTNALPEQICQVFSQFSLVRSGEKHGTVGVVLDGSVYEITTYRTEGGYDDNRHPDWVRFVSDLEDDLSRRDFTVNAMAYHPDKGYQDPYGGFSDLQAGILRTVGDPETRFREDALRILRGVRFACRFGLTPEPATEKAMNELSPLLDNLAKERIYSEMSQILCHMDEKTLLRFQTPILQVIPELRDSVGFAQHNPHHRYDVFTHTAHVLSLVEADPVMRWAALLHDVGKPQTFSRDEKGVGHFIGHASVSATIANDVLHRLKAPTAVRDQVVCLILHHMDLIKPDREQLRRLLSKYGADMTRKMIAFQLADRNGTGKTDDSRGAEKLFAMVEELEKSEGRLQIRDLAIGGRDLIEIGYAPGPEIGACQKYLLEQVLSGKLNNEKAPLLHAAMQFKENTNTTRSE